MLYSLFEKSVDKQPQKTAFQIKRNNVYQKYSYQEVKEKALALAQYLREEQNVQPDDHVAVWGESIPEWAIAYLGINFAGAIAVPLDAQLPPAAAVNLLRFSEASFVLCSQSLRETLEQVQQELEVGSLFLEPDEQESILKCAAAKEDFKVHHRGADEVISVIFTSGTTGAPKGVMLTANNLISNAGGSIDSLRADKEDSFLCVLPLHHCYAFTATFLGPIMLGATVTFQPVLQGPAIVAALQENNITVMPGVPQLFSLFDHAIFDKIKKQSIIKKSLFWSLYSFCHYWRKVTGKSPGRLFFKQIHQRFGDRFRLFVSGGAKLDQKIAEHFWDLGIAIAEGYGLTETSPVITTTNPDRFVPGTVGTPIKDVEVKIHKPNDSGVGEIIMRGPNLMKGYYKNPEETKKAVRNGWFHTGDLGYMDHKEQLYITGRAKEVIVLSSGKNIYPADVEKEYEICPLISELCVMGKKRGDGKATHLTAVIVPDFEEVKRRKISNIYSNIKFQVENVSMRLPSYMRLTSFTIISEPLPRTRLQKLKRKEIEKRKFEELKEGQKPQEELSEEDQALLAKPGADYLLSRLKELADYQGDILPSDSLELDIGLESIKFMELLVVLDQEYGIKFSPENPPTFTHVRDVLKVLPKDIESQSDAKFSWPTQLQKPCDPPLEELFNLKRGFWETALVEVIRFCARNFFRIYCRAKTKRLSKLATNKEPVILAPNHQSYLDAVILFAFLPRQQAHYTFFIALDAIFSHWFLSKLVRLFRIIRTASALTALTSLQYAAHALEKGYSVCIFPEGERSADGKIQEPMKGAGILSCEKQVPVYPILIEGGMDSLSRKNPKFRPCKMSYTLLEKLEPPQKESFSEEDYLEMMRRWKEQVLQAREEQKS